MTLEQVEAQIKQVKQEYWKLKGQVGLFTTMEGEFQDKKTIELAKFAKVKGDHLRSLQDIRTSILNQRRRERMESEESELFS